MSIELRSILIAFISALGLYWYVDGNFALALGRATGALVIPFAVAYFASRGRLQNTKNVAFSIAAVVVIAVASVPFYNTHELKESTKAAADKLNKIVDAQEQLLSPRSSTEANANSGAERREIEAAQGSTSRMLKTLTESKERELSLTKAFQESPEFRDIRLVLNNPFSFSTLSGLRQLRSALTAYEQRQSSYYAEVAALSRESIERMRSNLSTPRALEAFNSGVNSSRVKQERIAAIDAELLSTYRNSADLLEPLVAFGQVSVSSDGQILIENDAVRASFNQNVVKIQRLAAEQEQLTKDMIASQRAAVERMRDM